MVMDILPLVGSAASDFHNLVFICMVLDLREFLDITFFYFDLFDSIFTDCPRFTKGQVAYSPISGSRFDAAMPDEGAKSRSPAHVAVRFSEPGWNPCGTWESRFPG